jgi:hypothetical protein
MRDKSLLPRTTRRTTLSPDRWNQMSTPSTSISGIVYAWSQFSDACGAVSGRPTSSYISEISAFIDRAYFKTLKQDIADAVLTIISVLQVKESIPQADATAMLKVLLEDGQANPSHARLFLTIWLHHNPAAWERLYYVTFLLDRHSPRRFPTGNARLNDIESENLQLYPVNSDFSTLTVGEVRHLLSQVLFVLGGTGFGMSLAGKTSSTHGGNKLEGLSDQNVVVLTQNAPPPSVFFKTKSALMNYVANLTRPEIIQQLIKYFDLKCNAVYNEVKGTPELADANTGELTEAKIDELLDSKGIQCAKCLSRFDQGNFKFVCIVLLAFILLVFVSRFDTPLSFAGSSAKIFLIWKIFGVGNLTTKSCGCEFSTHVYCTCPCEEGGRKRSRAQMTAISGSMNSTSAPTVSVYGAPRRRKKLRGGLGQNCEDNMERSAQLQEQTNYYENNAISQMQPAKNELQDNENVKIVLSLKPEELAMLSPADQEMVRQIKEQFLDLAHS